jgi:hypothetical protein
VKAASGPGTATSRVALATRHWKTNSTSSNFTTRNLVHRAGKLEPLGHGVEVFETDFAVKSKAWKRRIARSKVADLNTSTML